MKESEEMAKYFDKIHEGVTSCYSIAGAAREQGYDPEQEVDVRLAKNMAQRVEGLMSSVAPELAGSGFTKRIMELEKQYGPLDWRVALKIAEEVSKGKFCRFETEQHAMEIGIRAGFTYHTGGIVSAPLEGFTQLRIKKNRSGKDYIVPCYAGPIRGAGGTAAAFSLVIADYVRHVMGYGKYDASDQEVNRFKTEIDDYHDRVTNLQYKPKPEEIDFLIRHLPVEVDGEPTEKIEVSNYKDVERVETNRIRGGICLVLAEGLSQKAPKLWKRLSVWGKEFGLDWEFLEEFLSIQKKLKAKDKAGKQEKLSPNYTYISDPVGGRPVLSHPMAAGGFRLRYGRTRMSGFSCAAIHPATMYLLNKFIAVGTQLKMERPGKAASITPCDTLEGPTVKLEDGTVKRVQSISQAKACKTQLEEILFLGDVLFNYGDFSENGHALVPVGYNEEWWKRELEKAVVDMFGVLDHAKVSDLADLPLEDVKRIFATSDASTEESYKLSKTLGVPFHPEYTYYWKLLLQEKMPELIAWLRKAKVYKQGRKVEKAVLPYSGSEKEILEVLAVPHKCAAKEFVVIEKDHAEALLLSLGMLEEQDAPGAEEKVKGKAPLEAVHELSSIKIRDKAGTFIGARMGRPEKAKMRKMAGSPHVLFPIGDEGGRLRSFQSAMEAGRVSAEFPIYKCPCGNETVLPVCEECGQRAKKMYLCKECGLIEEPVCKKRDKDGEHGPASAYRKQEIDIVRLFKRALEKTGDKVYPDLIKGVRGTSNEDHVPEHIIKGLLRAKHEVYVNKDGTVRFDMTELPITHFRPQEIGCSIEKAHALGYSHDIHGRELTDPSQVVEIRPQDVILPAGPDGLEEQSDKVLYRVACFVDELLQKLYSQKPYYKLKEPEDLIGHYVIGLAPHISAGTVGRIIGFSTAQGMLAHPLLHAAMRRDCDGDEACVILLMDALLNFSRNYLPATRGAKTMDAPLVLTSKVVPSEVDDMVHGLDIVWEYPLELYKAAEEMKNPWDIHIDQVKHFLGTERQYEKVGYTHEIKDINLGVTCSAYKVLPSMEEKIKGQMELAEKIRAVDASDVARLVIEKHLLRDTKGNLRKFSTQQFRCIKCNKKYRRPPLAGKCSCSGRIIFTVSHGSVIKYLQPSISLSERYDVPTYVKQSLELLHMRIDGVFGKEKEIQQGLGNWFGAG